MGGWEYMVVKCKSESELIVISVNEKITERYVFSDYANWLGDQGWELVSHTVEISNAHLAHGIALHIIIFKRSK